ncbi:MAG: hypothetical protein OES09_10485 [Gammaproteobacteria bacterium]|nr:hypothetical protein [Gammaproteobacteria bacterium]
MKKLPRFVCSLLICVMSAVTSAADFDGSKPLICVAMEVADCVAGDACASLSPENVNLSTFLRIDFANKQIKGEHRTTMIQNQVNSDQTLVLQGVESGRGWSVSLAKETGDMVGVVAGQGFGFVVFGRCTVL